MTAAPDTTAVRVALWRALHVEVDPPPHVLKDLVGLRLAAPENGWRNRPDMNPEWTKRFRASIVARTRFIEDLVIEQAAHEERPGYEMSIRGAASSGTPFISFFAPAEVIALARKCGFGEARHVSASELTERYFAGRADGLKPGSEELLVAR